MLDPALFATDPEFAGRLAHFLKEVETEEGQTLEEPARSLAILAALMGCQGLEEFRAVLPEALGAGLTPVMAKEAVYQAVDYLGLGRARPFLTALNEVLAARGTALPLKGQATTTLDDRLEKAQKPRPPSLARTWKTRGSRGTSTAFWRQTALATTTPAKGSASKSGK